MPRTWPWLWMSPGGVSVATSPRCMARSSARRSSARLSHGGLRPTADGSPPADRGDRDPAMVGVGVGHHPSGGGTAPRGDPVGLDEPFPPGRLEGISAISGPRYSSSAASSTKTRPTWSISRMSAEQLIQLSQETAKRAGKSAEINLRRTPILTASPGRENGLARLPWPMTRRREHQPCLTAPTTMRPWFRTAPTRPGAEWHADIDSYDPAGPAGAAKRHAGDQVTVGPRSVAIFRATPLPRPQLRR